VNRQPRGMCCNGWTWPPSPCPVRLPACVRRLCKSGFLIKYQHHFHRLFVQRSKFEYCRFSAAIIRTTYVFVIIMLTIIIIGLIIIIIITSCRRASATICPAQACNGSAQRQPWARPAPISQYAPSSRPAAHAARRPNVRDRRQTDRCQTA